MGLENNNQPLFLPVVVVSRVDVGRVLREIRSLDAFMEQEAIRDQKSPAPSPRLTVLLEDTLNLNNIDPGNKQERVRLINFLESAREKAPILHMSFSAPATPRFTHKLVAYVRQEIHPLALLSIGLQPTIGAGCVLRTKNKFFNFSLREHFNKQKQILIDKLHVSEEPESNTTPANPQAAEAPHE